jgi:choline dehydrogenase-like flavoprotein
VAAESPYDVIIIGTGAGGGTLAHRLAPSGKRILLLERGGYLPREIENWDASAVFVQNRYVSPDTWYDERGQAFQPQIHYFIGGATKMYGAALYRLRKEDFGELRHQDGISPAWPITYDDMEPYYTQAEQLYQVHGRHGDDPTDPRASAQYPKPPVSNEPRMQQLFDDLSKGGFHPFHAPCGILLNEQDMAHGQCIRCSTCDGYPCLVHAKADAEVICVRPALAQYPNLTLLTHAQAVKLNTSSTGREVTEVVVARPGPNHTTKLETYRGSVVVIAAGAANSAKLLLMSANDKHPNGLANSSDMVGRNYVFHNSRAVLAVSTEENRTVFEKTVGLNDFYFGMPGFDYPMGNIQMCGKSVAPMYRGEKPHLTKLAPNWSLDEVAVHAVDFWLTTEDLPRPENRVTVDQAGRITLRYTPNNQVAYQKLYDQLKSMLPRLGMNPHHLIPRDLYLQNAIPIAACAHQAGTCRFGSDPKSSVLDLTCRAHDVDNLYVVDASFLPSIGAVNPALTVIANALRVGSHILERLSAGTPMLAGAGAR